MIGQDTTLYGADRPGWPRIHELLARLAAIPHLRWLRLLYTHPAHFTDELVEVYAALPKLCPYIDLPLQHMNDDILRRMGRGVTQNQILDLIGRIRRRVPGVAIRTSLIVGFPGETRKQFLEMLRLVREIEFDHLGAFKYSREDGTRAARMGGQLSEVTKARRLSELMLAQQEVVAAKNRAMRGSVKEAVIERPAPDKPGTWIARLRTQAPDVDSVTYVTGDGLRPGQFLQVRIKGWSDYDLLAVPE